MKRVVWLALFILMLTLFSQGAVAVKPNIEFRPEGPDIISKDASFVVIVDPKTTEKPIRVTWSVYDTGSEGVGSFPIIDGKGVCYFSNEDENATCGPSPFRKAGMTELYVYVVTKDGVENQTEVMNISDITLENKEITREGNTINMVFYTPLYDSFTYKIYHEDFKFFTQGVLTRTPYGAYIGNKTLNPGVYYFAFYAKKNDTYGTDLVRIIIPSGDYLTIQTSKESYWKGEKAKITGTTNAEEVTGKIYFPNGTKAKEFDIAVLASNFSYEFLIPSFWPEGKYNLTTSKPLPESLEFSVADLIEITPNMVSERINKSDDFNKTITLKNLGNTTANLTMTVTGDIGESQVTLGSETLGGSETTTLAISVPSVQVNLAGKINIGTDLGVNLEIPVSISVEKAGGECPPCPECQNGTSGTALVVTPKILSLDCVAGEKITESVDLSNNGGSTLTQFTYDVDDIYSENSLSNLKATGDLNIDLSDLSIPAGGSKSVDIEITPYNSGTYKGMITIKSGGNEAYMLVSLNCFESMSDDITLLQGELDLLNLPEDSGVYTEISNLLSNAQDAYDVGNYKEAQSNIEKARTKITTVQDLGATGGGGIDMTIPIIIIVVLAVAGAAYYFLIYRKKATGAASPEEFEEEF